MLFLKSCVAVASSCFARSAFVAIRAPRVNAALLTPSFDAIRTVKTKSSVKKRFSIKSSGVIMRAQGGKRHLNITKSRSRINGLSTQVIIRENAVRKNYQHILGARVRGRL